MKAFKYIAGNVTGTSSGSQSLTDMDYDANDKLIRSCDLIKNVSYKYVYDKYGNVKTVHKFDTAN